MKLPVLNNEQPDVCGPCGGQCCKSGPGIYHPDDFTGHELRKAIVAGTACIDWWEGSLAGVPGPVYYVRPPVVGGNGRKLHGASGGACANLSDDGCKRDFDVRPRQCRLLIPKTATRDCHYVEHVPGQSYKEMGVRWWLSHQLALRSLVAQIGAGVL